MRENLLFCDETGEDGLFNWGPGAMRDYPSFGFDLAEVKNAGKVIAGELPWSDETAPEITRAFNIANSWRDAHAYPMRSIRLHVAYYMRHLKIDGVTAARLKRMQAIRRKLRRFNIPLNRIQDLGGCRAILPSIADVNLLVVTLKERARHHLRSESDYIAAPKDDGYRSHHLMFDYRGKAATKTFEDRRIELQVRTVMQHSWATAVEAVGLLRREDLKSHKGDERWLRLFKLMSAEFAVAEGCLVGADLPDQPARIEEIKALNTDLDAAGMLDKISYAVRWTDQAVAPTTKPTYYLIRFNNAKQEVEIDVEFRPIPAAAHYDNAESSDNQTGLDVSNIVLVEADKVQNLKEAYPNYFGDVQMFKEQLKNIVSGIGAQDYIVKPQQAVSPVPRELPANTLLGRKIRW